LINSAYFDMGADIRVKTAPDIDKGLMDWIYTVLLVCGAYLLGSFPSGLLIGKWVGHIDVRAVGSGNIGATNVARNLGLQWGLLVLVLDVTKGALPVLVALHAWPAEVEGNLLKISVVALAAFLGHVWSVFLRFRGGKGVATTLGITLILIPKALFPSLLVFLLITWRWRYVSLGSITAVLTLPIWAALLGYDTTYIGLSVILAVCIVGLHYENVHALMRGTERKFR
jgi:glycerol-3-phosphate acyltransferase PlsY